MASSIANCKARGQRHRRKDGRSESARLQIKTQQRHASGDGQGGRQLAPPAGHEPYRGRAVGPGERDHRGGDGRVSPAPGVAAASASAKPTAAPNRSTAASSATPAGRPPPPAPDCHPTSAWGCGWRDRRRRRSSRSRNASRAASPSRISWPMTNRPPSKPRAAHRGHRHPQPVHHEPAARETAAAPAARTPVACEAAAGSGDALAARSYVYFTTPQTMRLPPPPRGFGVSL